MVVDERIYERVWPFLKFEKTGKLSIFFAIEYNESVHSNLKFFSNVR